MGEVATSGSLRKNFRARAGHGHEVDRVACSLVSDSMALLRSTQRRASVHADAPRLAGQKIIKRFFSLSLYPSFCACVQEPSAPPAWDRDAVLLSEETWPA